METIIRSSLSFYLAPVRVVYNSNRLQKDWNYIYKLSYKTDKEEKFSARSCGLNLTYTIPE